MVPSGVREVVGIFHDLESLRSAADELMLQGFDRARLDLLHIRPDGRGAAPSRAVRELEADPRAPRMGYVGTDSLTEARAALVGVPAFIGVVAAAAPAAAAGVPLADLLGWALAGAVLGGGIGGFFSHLVNVRHTRYLRQQLDRGGLVLWVGAANAEEEAAALAILERNGAEDVHVQARPPEAAEGGPAVIAGYLDWLAGMPRSGPHHAPPPPPAEAGGMPARLAD